MATYCAVCGQKLGILSVSVQFRDGKVCDKCFKSAGGEISFSSISERVELASKTVTEWQQMNQPKVYRIKCNACGNLFCYSNEDIKLNKLYLRSAKREARMGGMNSLFGSQLVAQGNLEQAERDLANVKDFNHCPKCNSTDLRELSDAEYEKEKVSSSSTANASFSAADELKKFKELLDSGIISQEEFDVKKKQLLGL